jgi:hypothetical protein
MARVSQNGPTTFHGFSISQAHLGAPLQWLPTIGTPELDDLIHAFLPGPSPIQDKRAHISMDFFENARRTGITFQYYPVPSASLDPTSTNSPASFSPFDVSPVISDLSSWGQSPASFATPSVSAETTAPAPRSSSSKKTHSRASGIDFSNHPGMRIMTKDGRDITNSASRGTKTKEQRDHAHLMRIIKACDSCKKKKIRCDPSHRRRNNSQASIAPPTELKATKKAKSKAASPPMAPPIATSSSFDAGLIIGNSASFDPLLDFSETFPAFDSSMDTPDAFWDQFVHYDTLPYVHASTYDVSQDSTFTRFAPSQITTPSTISSSMGSPSQVFTPLTPSLTSSTLSSVNSSDSLGGLAADQPAFPYLNPGASHGTNYVDFNLYSPASDFLDDEVEHLRALPPSPAPPRESCDSHPRTSSSTGGNFSPRVISSGTDRVRTSGLGQYHTEHAGGFHNQQLVSSESLRGFHNQQIVSSESLADHAWASGTGTAQRSQSMAQLGFSDGHTLGQNSSVGSSSTHSPAELSRTSSRDLLDQPQSSRGGTATRSPAGAIIPISVSAELLPQSIQNIDVNHTRSSIKSQPQSIYSRYSECNNSSVRKPWASLDSAALWYYALALVGLGLCLVLFNTPSQLLATLNGRLPSVLSLIGTSFVYLTKWMTCPESLRQGHLTRVESDNCHNLHQDPARRREDIQYTHNQRLEKRERSLVGRQNFRIATAVML